MKKEIKNSIKNNKKKMKKVISDFSSFAMKGNVVDLAVGVIMGSAFGKIVTSLVNDVVMPLMSMLIGEINLASLKVTLLQATDAKDAIVLSYGNFLQSIVEFLIIAFSIFMALKYLEKLHKKIDKLKKDQKAEDDKKKKEDSIKQEEVLLEIRDLLRLQSNLKLDDNSKVLAMINEESKDNKDKSNKK